MGRSDPVNRPWEAGAIGVKKGPGQRIAEGPQKFYLEVKRMDTRKGWIILMATALFLVNLNPFSLALDDESARHTARGLQGVYVAVEPLRPDTEEDGLTADQIRAETELKLQTAGIGILSLEEMYETEGNPRLCVSVAVMRPKAVKGYVCRISVELHQTAFLTRDPSVVADVATWRKEKLGISFSLDDIRGTVKEMVDEFVMAYRFANSPSEDLSLADE